MALLTSYPDAAKVKDKNGYTPLHTIAKRVSMSSLAASVAMARAVVNHWPAAARAKDRQGNTALLFLAMELMSKADQQRSRPQPQNTSGSHLFRALCHAYPLAAEIENDSGVSPISFLINLQVRALSAGRTPANEVTTRVPPIKSLLKGLRDGRPLKKLCNLERPSFLTMYLMLFFNDNSHDSSRNTKTIDINEEVIPGWTFLEILADLDNDDASDMLIQIVEQRGHWCSGDQNVKIVCSDDAKTILQFQTRNKATEETMRKVADRAKLSLSSERLRNWGQTYGRFLGRYRINKDQEPKHISETCVVAFAMESRVDGSGQRYEAQVALKFLSSFDAFCREIDKRRIIDLHYEAHAERHFVVPIVAAYTSIAENDASKAAQACMESVGVVYEANLLEGLQTHQNILTSGRGTDDIAYLLVMECGAGLDLHDVISHHNIAGRNLPMVLSIATCIAECLQYLNEKCQVVHGDVKARNFVSLGVGAGFAAIDLDNAASIEDCEAVGKKRTSSGYLPPEQARVEASLRGTKGAPLAHAMVHAELKGLKEEMIRAYDVGNYQEQLRLLEAHNEAKGKLEQIQNVAPVRKPVVATAQYDMWCFGVLLYYLCTGEQLFGMDTREDVKDTELGKIMSWNKKMLLSKLSLVSKGWPRGILADLLQPQPANRPTCWALVIQQLQHIEAFQTSFRMESTSSPSMWSISYWQLMEFDNILSKQFGSSYATMTMRDVNDKVLKPTCQKSGKSYALTCNPEGLMLDSFISHSWDEPFPDFVLSIRKVFQTTLFKPNLWICAFALNQCDAETVKAQVGTEESPLTTSPFVLALDHALTFVVVRNTVTDLYSRIWCVCECMYAKKLGLIPNKTHVTGPDMFSHLQTSCLEAKCTNPTDKERILDVLLKEHDAEEIDKFVHLFRTQETPE